MIHKTAANEWSLICDICGQETVTKQNDIDSTIAYKNENGWISEQHMGEWQDVCTECWEG